MGFSTGNRNVDQTSALDNLALSPMGSAPLRSCLSVRNFTCLPKGQNPLGTVLDPNLLGRFVGGLVNHDNAILSDPRANVRLRPKRGLIHSVHVFLSAILPAHQTIGPNLGHSLVVKSLPPEESARKKLGRSGGKGKERADKLGFLVILN